ncbi:transaldolase [Umboniibacter marinipuniceus]|uniref:Transaldolase n=1 Tax=Umboniibacter marinipuniceus TaxID=569599 RepID=A0A3M0A5V1_9GAMM|nr:transaldolase [Umboniibacter marinipuniceus]RMA78889.1 transaldolase [Umboniibacter marinipuniceus]
MASKLDQLKAQTVVVADTGDIDAIAKFTPVDATTNPSLLLKAAQLERYRHFFDEAIETTRRDSVAEAVDQLAVNIGKEILGIIPGRISTEVDARLSYDQEASYQKAHSLIKRYEAAGVSRDRVLIKLASTWEGIRAAERLEQDGINTNLTLLFSFEQAVACAEAGVFLISPFVGRILDWYKKAEGVDSYASHKDPGVVSVKRIYEYYKQHAYPTIVMGASFRNTGEIEELAGCDQLTIGPALLEELDNDLGELPQKLFDQGGSADQRPARLSEAEFRFGCGQDAMATEKLAEGIRNFVGDQIKLEALLLKEANV